MLSERDIDWVLDALCVRLGFCLDPMVRDDLKNSPPQDAVSFTEVIFQAQGFEATSIDPTIYAEVDKLVIEAYGEASQRSA